LASTIKVTAEPSAETTTPTTTHYQQLATELMKALDQIAAIIPPTEPVQSSAMKAIRAHMIIPDEFCGTTLVSVEQLPELQVIECLDVIAGRDTLQFLDAFRPVEDKILAFGKTLHFALMVRKDLLVTQSLRTYDIAKGIARDNRTVAAHVANMKRDLARTVPKAERDERKALKAAKAKTAAVQKEVKAA
jgi:hypothetical protein